MSHNSKTMLFSKRGHFQPSSWNSQPPAYLCLPKHIAAWRWRFWRHLQNRVVFAWFAKSLKEAPETPEMFILSGSVGSHPPTYTRNKDFIRPSGRNHGYSPPLSVFALEKGWHFNPRLQLPSFPTMPFPDLQWTCWAGKKTYPILPSPRFSSAPWKLLNM